MELSSGGGCEHVKACCAWVVCRQHRGPERWSAKGSGSRGCAKDFLTKSRSVTGGKKKEETKQSPARETVLSAPTRTCALLSGTAVKLQGKQRWYFAMVGEGWGLGHAMGGDPSLASLRVRTAKSRVRHAAHNVS